MPSDRLRRIRRRLPPVALFICSLLMATSLSAEPSLALDFISNEKIGYSASGLSEPSGLAVSATTGELWVVSDDTTAVFKLSPDNPATVVTLHIDEDEMEAITLAEDDSFFYTLNETKGRIARFAMADGRRLGRQKIRAMAGYAGIRASIKAAGSKSGFESMAW